jgi:hypothetical protein
MKSETPALAERWQLRSHRRTRQTTTDSNPTPKLNDYSTVTLFARLRGLSIDRPSFAAV